MQDLAKYHGKIRASFSKKIFFFLIL